MCKPEKNKGVISQEHYNENEEFFSAIDFTNPMEVALGFGTWLNLYFNVWNQARDTWIDSNEQAFTTEELLLAFNKEYNPNL